MTMSAQMYFTKYGQLQIGANHYPAIGGGSLILPAANLPGVSNDATGVVETDTVARMNKALNSSMIVR